MGMSHATCTHPRTPAGRAACRKSGGPNANPTPTAFAPSATVLDPRTDVLRGLGDVRRMAMALMVKHGLTVSWRFGFDNAKRRLGACHYGKRMITMSEALVLANIDKPDVLRDTMLHEIAHAIAGPRTGHGAVWRATVLSIGGKAERCYSTDDVTGAPAPFMATCGTCGRESRMFRRPRVTRACGACCRKFNGGRYDARYNLTFRATGN